MAIEYLEIRDMNRELIGIIDTAKSVIWHEEYYGVGDFEIYAKATPENIYLLNAERYINGENEIRYVTRPDKINGIIGIIEAVNILDSLQDGKMIIATGRFAKSILERRLIYRLSGKTNTPTVLRGNVEANIRQVVSNNAISCPFDNRRNIGELELGPSSSIPDIIIDANGNPAEKQVSYENLLEYSDGVLQEYGLSGIVYLDTDNVAKKLKYQVIKGTDRSVDNENSIDPIVFGKEYDNLTESEYIYDSSTEKNTALIGGEGEGVERFYSLVAPNKAGLSRREIWVDASSLNKTLKSSELQALFPTGSFSGINFVVSGVTYATLVLDLDGEYSLSSLQSKFPTGTVSGTKFKVGNVVYANKIYGDDNDYKLTPLGYKAMLDKDGKEGDYLLSDSIYKSMLDTKGKQEIAQLFPTEIFNGTINVSSGNYILNEDFYLGDVVTVQENDLGLYINVRITETTEVQDENGYAVEVKYE